MERSAKNEADSRNISVAWHIKATHKSMCIVPHPATHSKYVLDNTAENRKPKRRTEALKPSGTISDHDPESESVIKHGKGGVERIRIRRPRFWEQ